LIYALRRCQCEDQYLRLAQSEPDAFNAIEIWAGPPATRRGEIEARVLANEPAESIAKRFAMRPEVVEQFEEWFFTVRPYLGAESFICHNVIKPFGELDDATIWKLAGYRGGSFVLDALIYGPTENPAPQSADEVAAFFDRDNVQSVHAKCWVGILRTPADGKTGIKMAKLALQISKARAR
jgi:hypothetical protein